MAKRIKKRISRGAGGRRRATAASLGVELKYYDQKLVDKVLTQVADATGGEVNPSGILTLNSVAQGDEETNRDGRKIVMKFISVHGLIHQPITANQTSLGTNAIVFLALVLDTQTNNAPLSSEDVFQNVAADSIMAAQLFRNLKFNTRFRVLKKMQIRLEQPRASFDGSNIEIGGTHTQFKMDVRLNDIPVLYSAVTEATASIVDNSLHMIAWFSDSGAYTPPELTYASRLRFVG